MQDYHILVNRDHPLKAGFRAAQLVEAPLPFCTPAHDEKRLLDRRTAKAAQRLFQAARRKNLYLIGVSGYRSYIRQFSLYQKNGISGEVAPAGTSEHQTGLALDVSCLSLHGELNITFADTPEGRFLTRAAPLYGFILRYPRGKETITGYPWEPWHIRYVGVPLALYLTLKGITLEEYYRIAAL